MCRKLRVRPNVIGQARVGFCVIDLTQHFSCMGKAQSGTPHCVPDAFGAQARALVSRALPVFGLLAKNSRPPVGEMPCLRMASCGVGSSASLETPCLVCEAH